LLRERLGAVRNPLPEGSLPVGAGFLLFGVTAYGFLVVSARALGPERYGSLSVLWALVYLAGPGFFLPLEQEVGRVMAARRARGLGSGPLVRRAALAGTAVASLLVLASLLYAPTLVDRLFDGDFGLLAGFALAIAGYSVQHLARGALSGNGRFRAYGLVLGAEGAIRLLAALVLAVLGIGVAGPYGIALGLAPFAAVALVLSRERGLLTEGPEAPWSELSVALGYLLASSLLAQFLVNAGPLAVRILSAEGEEAAAGRFLAGLVVARIPLFMFQAVQAALLPKLAGLAGAGRHSEFRLGFKKLLAFVVVLGTAATLGAFAVGPWVVRVLFGPDFALGRRDLAYLAGAAGLYMVALALAQALIALSGHAWVAIGWVAGAVGFTIVTSFGTEVFLRVERGFLIGSAAAAVAMACALIARLRVHVPTDPYLLGASRMPAEG
jgi:O-antigen/teichoic acid export membrane protein